MTVTLDDIRIAAERILPHVHRTPILSSAQLDAIAGCELHFKGEHLQKVGAFKARGAHNAVFALSEEQARLGVATHSSGNHAAALALAAKRRGISADIVMPSNAPQAKVDAVKGYGGHIHFCEPTLEARETTLAAVRAEGGQTEIHPYDNDQVIAGQGTTGLEITEQLAQTPPDVVITPVGGGGLLAGTAVAIKSLWPQCQVLGAEPSGADDAQRSFRAGRLIEQTGPDTVCDGLLTSLGVRNFALIQQHVDDILCADDSTIIEAMQLIWSRLKQVVEPSAAVPLACVLAHPERFAGKRVAIVFSGGNLDLAKLPW
ncbi:pyridoxal-phosphate dependent enzyme [Ferrimonas marina]|uniref:Threonine dehydratase n=1 Tax=Ferrimonas marina TaxID=299255 RepID=A0A1M5MKM6_9GAMM|nr:pyridoxal-phosphate dependent enzyme [Ferrimonas marina]SHG77323.1 threonine dehydratase [Ferrimonas marina]